MGLEIFNVKGMLIKYARREFEKLVESGKLNDVARHLSESLNKSVNDLIQKYEPQKKDPKNTLATMYITTGQFPVFSVVEIGENLQIVAMHEKLAIDENFILDAIKKIDLEKLKQSDVSEILNNDLKELLE